MGRISQTCCGPGDIACDVMDIGAGWDSAGRNVVGEDGVGRKVDGPRNDIAAIVECFPTFKYQKPSVETSMPNRQRDSER